MPVMMVIMRAVAMSMMMIMRVPVIKVMDIRAVVMPMSAKVSLHNFHCCPADKHTKKE